MQQIVRTTTTDRTICAEDAWKAPERRTTMATPVLASEHTSSPVSCGNCGRPYGSGDGLRVMQFTGTSVLGLRSLVARQFETIKCPACEADLRFEPAVFVVGIDPPVGYICGGNALSRDQVLHLCLPRISFSLKTLTLHHRYDRRGLHPSAEWSFR